MRRTVGRQWLMVLSVVTLMTAALPAFAQAPPTTPPTAPPATVASPCDSYAGLTAKIAGCIRDGIDKGAETFFDPDNGIYQYLTTAINAVITLAVIIYGIALAYGAVEKIGRDTYIMLMKVAAVVFFCNSGPFIIQSITGAMDGAASAVISYTPPSSDTAYEAGTVTQQNCVQNLITQQSNADPKLQIMLPWLGVDCLVDTVIGIHIIPTTVPTHDGTWFNKQLADDETQGMSRSLLYLFFGAMQTSILGLLMAIIGFFFIYGLLMLIVRSFFAYIAGYMGVTFLTIISPLIIPLILFKETKQYFDKWAKMLVSFALQPIIMLVFLVFSLTALDLAVYSGSYSIYYAIAGSKSQEPKFKLNEYLTTASANDDGTSTGIINADSKRVLSIKADSPQAVPRDARDSGGTLNKLLYSGCTPAAIKADPTLATKCNFTYPVTLLRHTIDWAKMEKMHDPAITPEEKPGQAISRMVLSSMFFCLMVVFILNGLLQVVPMIVGDLLGDLNQSPIIGSLGTGGKGGSLSKMISNPFKGMGSIGK